MIRNPFVNRGMIKSEARFWGRESEIQSIYSLLLDSEEEPQSMVVVGLRRIGKSSLLYRIAQKRGALPMYEDQLDRAVCVMLSMQEMTNASVDEFFGAILADLRKDDTIEKMLTTQSPHPMETPEQELCWLLRVMDREEYLLVLLLDEFECAASNPRFDKSFFDLLRSLAQMWRLAFIVATQTDLGQLWDQSLVSSPYSSPFFNIFQTITLSGFDNGETVNYIDVSLAETGICFGDVEMGIIQDAGGLHPFFINVAAYHLFQTLAEREKLLPSEKDALWAEIIQDPTICGNLRYYWQNMIPARRRILVEAAQGGLREPFAADVRVDVGWLARMGLLQKHGDKVYKPFSRAFQEFVLDESHDVLTSKPGEADQGRSIQDLIAESEGVSLEFKSSLRWDYHQNKPYEGVELAVIKTLAAFMNTDGGTLIIGMDDEHNVLGLDKDYCTFSKKDHDGFELHLTRLISDKIGKSFCQYCKVTFHSFGKFEICQVDVDASPEPVYVAGKETTFYIRTGNSTQELDIRESVQYIRRHWVQ